MLDFIFQSASITVLLSRKLNDMRLMTDRQTFSAKKLFGFVCYAYGFLQTVLTWR